MQSSRLPCRAHINHYVGGEYRLHGYNALAIGVSVVAYPLSYTCVSSGCVFAVSCSISTVSDVAPVSMDPVLPNSTSHYMFTRYY